MDHCNKMIPSLHGGLILSAVIFSACDKRPADVTDEQQDLPNILFITIDDLRNDLGALGVDHAKTPHLDAFADQGRLFSRHYVQVPSCGPARATLLRGKRPDDLAYIPNSAIRDTHEEWGDQSLPSWFRQHGYTTLSLGKITHYPGGLTGEGWAEGPEELPGAWDKAWVPESSWKTPQDMMHGYANGAPRERGASPAWEAYDGPDEAYPDAWVANDAIKTLNELKEQEDPWFFAVGFFKPHLPFAAPEKWWDVHDPQLIPEPNDTIQQPDPSSWHPSSELMNNYGQHPGNPNDHQEYARTLRHGYTAATSYMDAQVGRVIDACQQLELDNTIVVIWSDHGFALGERGTWGKHSLYETALKSPLIIHYPGMQQPGEISDAIVESTDIFPTLTALAGLPAPDGLDGTSLQPQLEDPRHSSEKPAFGYFQGGQTTVRTEDWRLIVHRTDGVVEGYELFDFRNNPEGRRTEPDNHPSVVAQLMNHIESLAWRNLN